MKAEINLLPPDFQAHRSDQQYWQGMEYILRRLIGALLLVAIMFGGTYVFFRSTAIATPLQSNTTTAAADLKKRVEQTNELVAAVDTHLHGVQPWTENVGQILSVVPVDITLQSISLTATSPNLTIKGISQSRAAVVAFEQAVGALLWVAGIESPLQNFASGSSTPFTVIIKRHATP